MRNWAALLPCMLVWTTGMQAQAQSQPQPETLPSQSGIALEREVVVNAPEVRLSDLLSPATVSEQAAAAGIVLGRSPEPGSVRAFTAQEIESAAGSRVKLRAPEQVRVRRGWPVSSEQVRNALAAFKTKSRLDGNEVEITVPAEIVTRTQGASLKVVSVQARRSARVSLARLRCIDRSDCGAFFVTLHGAVAAFGANQDQRKSLGLRTKPVLVQPGRKALLVIVSGEMRITLPVVPLGRGGLGDSVRVLDAKARRVLVARVLGEGLLQSDLQEGR